MIINKFIFLIFLLFIPSVSATTVLNNTISDNEEYISNSVDSEYTTNISDIFNSVNLEFTVSSYPQKIIYTFYDKNNNSLLITNTISKENHIIGFTIVEKFDSYYNLNKLTTRYEKTYINDSHIFFLGFDKFYGNNHITINDQNEINVIKGNINSGILQDYFLMNNQNIFLPQRLTLSSQNIFLNYSKIRLGYQDKTEAIIKYTITKDYDLLNPIFKFVFLGGKAFIGIANFAGIISDIDYQNFQLAVLFPLKILNLILNTIIFIVTFVLKNLLISLAMIILITFIFAVITTKNIYEAIPKFLNNTIYILSLLIVKPVIWIFEKIVKFWS